VSLLELFQQSTLLYLLLAGALGLLVGSFLNVVIHRLPLMLKQQWKAECQAFLAEDAGKTDNPETPAPFNLVVPRSRCPHCGHLITALENIPLLSYLVLRGRCRECRATISIRYPLIEFTSAVLTVTAAWYFGVSWQAVGAILLGWALLSLAVIDYDHQYLPDIITLPFLWLGLLFNLNGVFVSLSSAVIGAMAGYLFLWTIYQAFRILTGKEGMGFGDFKLLAMLGAWLGWQALPAIIILSSLVGSVIGIGLIVLRQHQRTKPIPFGPYLAIAGWITLLWGDAINAAYLSWLGQA
jgi:leader peptidase (prepilin peptidase)/N-methyltransferase